MDDRHDSVLGVVCSLFRQLLELQLLVNDREHARPQNEEVKEKLDLVTLRLSKIKSLLQKILH
jgi:hypothetical protein